MGGLVGSVVSGVIGYAGSKKAGKQQANSANQAAQMQMDMFERVRKDLDPFIQTGAGQRNALLSAINDPRLNKRFEFSAAGLEDTPGYKFARQQGLKAVQNQSAARGLGMSGAQMKGAMNFATGLADQTYGNQFDRALQGFQTNYNAGQGRVNNLANLVNMGASAAAGAGQMGMQAAQGAGNMIYNAGTARAAGTMGGTNAITGAIGDMSGMYTTDKMLGNMGMGSIYGF